jgi:hypothetical protein
MSVSNINIAIACWFVRRYPCSASGVWSERVLLAIGHFYLESNLTSLYRSISYNVLAGHISGIISFS